MVFELNGTDFSQSVVSGSYKVNEEDVYDKYTDANGREHRNIYRTRVSGSFNMLFRSGKGYQDFLTCMSESKTKGGYHPCKLAVNNKGTIVERDMFISFAPGREIDGSLRQKVGEITINVEEV